MGTRVQNNRFDSRSGLSRGRSYFIESVWYLFKLAFFTTRLPWPTCWKLFLLRAFGAKVGKGVVLKPAVNITFPWKLEIGDHAWIGEEVWLLNLEPIVIGAHACVSQRAFLCTGNHDYRSWNMRYRNAAIRLDGGVWIGAQVFVGPGVQVGVDAVVTAGSVVTKDLPAGMICSGSPCTAQSARWRESQKS